MALLATTITIKFDECQLERILAQPGGSNLVLLDFIKHQNRVTQGLLTELLEKVQTMSTQAVTRDQFDAALQQLLQAEAARDAAVTKALDDLIAKVNAGTVTTPEDFAAELGTVSTLMSNAAAITQTATVDDPGPTDVPTTPIDTGTAGTDSGAAPAAVSS